jgi:uroporphyrin-3 C-methyltransferase
VTETETDPPTDSSAEHAPLRRTRRSRLGLWMILAGLLAAGLAGLYLWTELQRARSSAVVGEAWRLEAESLSARLDALDRRLQQLVGDQRGVDGRISEMVANQRVIRQELLGTGERAATIEDAVARLSDQRLRGETTLKLNEIEALLVLAAQRLELARDADGARLALRLASSALQTLEDPLYAGLALPLRAELQLLQNLPPDPLPALRSVLGDSLRALPNLPRAPLSGVSADPNPSSFGGRLQQALSALIVVRKREAALGSLSGSARDAALEALQLDLRSALAAAEARDPDGVAAALARALPLFEALFDPSAAEVSGLRQQLAELRPQALAQPLPTLGTSLAELRALRGSRLRLAPTDSGSGSGSGSGPDSDPAPAAADAAQPQVPASASSSTSTQAATAAAEPEPEREPAPKAEPAGAAGAVVPKVEPAALPEVEAADPPVADDEPLESAGLQP